MYLLIFELVRYSVLSKLPLKKIEGIMLKLQKYNEWLFKLAFKDVFKEEKMREIKFRAWNKKTKLMRYDIFDVRLGNDEDYEIMQFTGLKDKNGKEIYEGDIIRYEKKHYLIKWGKKNKAFIGKIKGDKEEYILSEADKPDELEVIGNIYENPELLRK